MTCIITGWLHFLDEFELNHELPDDSVQILVHSFIDLIKTLVDGEDLVELTAIITVDMLPEIFLELLCKPSQSHLDELSTLADGNFGLRGRLFGE